jgi:hypothetical protein
MKKVLPILVFFLLLYSISFSQEWHSVTDTLKLPVSINNGMVSDGFFNRFDTVECNYVLKGSHTIYKGYKFVFVMQGFYTDTSITLYVFFDEKKHRIVDVQRFYFN